MADTQGQRSTSVIASVIFVARWKRKSMSLSICISVNTKGTLFTRLTVFAFLMEDTGQRTSTWVGKLVYTSFWGRVDKCSEFKMCSNAMQMCVIHRNILYWSITTWGWNKRRLICPVTTYFIYFSFVTPFNQLVSTCAHTTPEWLCLTYLSRNCIYDRFGLLSLLDGKLIFTYVHLVESLPLVMASFKSVGLAIR